MIKYSICNAGVVVDEEIVKRAREILAAFHRNEREMQSLAPIPEGFFEVIAGYLEKLYTDLEKVKDQDLEVADALSKSIRKTQKQVREIFSMRIEKILRFVQMETLEEMQNATKEEWDIYNSSRQMIKKYRDDVFARCRVSVRNNSKSDELRDGSKGSTNAQRDDQPQIKEINEISGDSKSDKDHSPAFKGGSSLMTRSNPHPNREKTQENILIRVKEDIPPFSVQSGTYELKKGDISYLPAVVAQILVKRGVAERIESEL